MCFFSLCSSRVLTEHPPVSDYRHAPLWLAPIFNFFGGNLHTISHYDGANLHFHQLCVRDPFSLHLHQYLLLLAFLITAILTTEK